MYAVSKNQCHLPFSGYLLLTRTVVCLFVCLFVGCSELETYGMLQRAQEASEKSSAVKFATIKGINTANPDVAKVFNMCKAAAESDGYEIFAIRVRVK